jgi:EAL domain-containing protein (putative c-di-GMP-specific phosphodiesterase class I)
MGLNFVDWLRDQRTPGGSRSPETYEIPEVLRAGELSSAFQPVVDLQTGEVFAYEALLRRLTPTYVDPPTVFARAIEARCCGALGRLTRQLATDGCRAWPLFLNVHPREFDEGWLVQPDDPVFLHEPGVYLEITESVPLSHFDLCQSVLAEIRGKGLFLAVDDLGAGYSNLKYIADLRPEMVKLDRTLIADLPESPRLQKVVRALVALCVDLGARVVAEGLERSEEASAAMDAGAHFGQGYLLARPGPTPPRTLGFDVRRRA